MKHNLVVILVNYNGFKVTHACLQSIAQNETETPFVILVDNASNEPYSLDDLKQEYPLLEIIRNNSNRGFGKANNIGIRWALENIDFNFLVLLNNDTTITPNALSDLTNDFHRDNIGIVTSRIMYEDQKDMVWYGGADINTIQGEPYITDMGQAPSPNGALISRNVTFASGCLMVFTRKSIEHLRGFDERFFMYVEDLELSMRCTKAGMKIWYNSEIVIYHKVQGSFKGNSPYKGMHPKNRHIPFQFYERKVNQWSTFKKHLSGFDFLKFFVVYWLKYQYLLLKLLVLSPYRKPLFFAHIKAMRSIMTGYRNKVHPE